VKVPTTSVTTSPLVLHCHVSRAIAETKVRLEFDVPCDRYKVGITIK
jgi:hypothetical protein